jgi:hypothetical protein
MTTIETKVCTKCSEERPASNFYSSVASPDGLYFWCRDCASVTNATNRERVNEFLLNWKSNKGYDISRKDAAILYGSQNEKNIQSFKARVIETEDGCHLFTGSTFHNGYGNFNVWISTGMQSVAVRAHRFAFYLSNGWLPQGISGNVKDGIVLNHKCHNRRCVNPEHLEAVTVKINCSPAKRKPKELFTTTA